MSAAEPLVAIHQPNFLPWLGFFDKLRRADVFVLLDDAQFPKKGGTWTNRVRMLVSGRPAWVTVPVDRSYHGTRAINEMRIDDDGRWREKVTRTIAQSYSGRPGFDEVFPWLEQLLALPTTRLDELNERAIQTLVDRLELAADTRLVRSSELGVEATGTERLIELTRAVGGGAYLSGGGAAGYQEDELFERAGVALRRQGFDHPRYSQPVEEFVPGLSIVDALMNEGLAGTRALLARGRS